MNSKARRLVTKWVPVVAWMLLIFAGSSDALSAEQTSRFIVPFLRWLDPTISLQTIALVHLGIRKLGHFTEYAILAALLWRALRDSFRGLSATMVGLAAFVVAAGFAISDEFHQSFVPSRTSSLHDVLIDCIGAIAATAICVMLSRTSGRLRAGPN